MDDDVVSACSGTYRPAPPDTTPRQRRLLRGFLVVWAVGVLLWAAQRWVAAGWLEALGVGLVVLVVAVLQGVLENLFVRLGPMTRIDPAGVFGRTAFRESRSAAWADVVGFLPPGGFRKHPAVQLADCGVQQLPGLPPDVVDRLAAALPPRPLTPRRQPPQGPGRGRTSRTPPPDVDGWDGPFHRSPRER